MPHAEILQSVRVAIRQTFAEFGVSSEAGISESILIRHDYYCGRRFEASGVQAIWFIEENELKFYAQDGAVLRVCTASDAVRESDSEVRRAA